MIGILVVSHGKMAEGMKDSVKMIVGDVAQFETLALASGQDIETLKTDIFDKSKQLDSGEGVLILVDLYGASPYNASMACLPQWNQLGMNVRVITGMNLPMLINAVCSRDSSTLNDLVKESIKAGCENIQDAISILVSSEKTVDSDDY